ncbi:MAG: alpha/beta fold hydrolase [Thermoanaerobaculia bacterium]
MRARLRERLRGVEVAYRTWGEPSPAGDNAVVALHALPAPPTSIAGGEAPRSRTGPGPRARLRGCAESARQLFRHHRPGLAAARAGELRGADFPAISVRDQARLVWRWLDALGIDRLRLAVGGSLGGMVALELALLDRGRLDAAALLQAPGRHGPWAIAFSELARRALELDPKFRGGRYPADDPPREGLAARARSRWRAIAAGRVSSSASVAISAPAASKSPTTSIIRAGDSPSASMHGAI